MTHLSTMNAPSLSIYEPSDADLRRWWSGFCGSRINRPAKDYMRGECRSLNKMKTELTVLETGWDPAFMLAKALESNEDHTATAPATAQQQSEQDFSNHAILKLEPSINKLDNQDQARSAQSRFSLIRENHRHSGDFVEELTESFAPLEQATTSRWQTISDCKRVCDDAAEKFPSLQAAPLDC